MGKSHWESMTIHFYRKYLLVLVILLLPWTFSYTDVVVYIFPGRHYHWVGHYYVSLECDKNQLLLSSHNKHHVVSVGNEFLDGHYPQCYTFRVSYTPDLGVLNHDTQLNIDT